MYLIPKDAIYILETEQPVRNWSKISKSETWKHLRGNSYFAELTAQAEDLDAAFSDNQGLFDFLGSRPLLISAHKHKKDDYDFLFVTDLQKTAVLTQFKGFLAKLLSKNYKLTSRAYQDVEIMELYDKSSRETLSFSFVENLLLASYTHTLVEASIRESKEPTIGLSLDFIDLQKRIGDDGMFRIFMNYEYFDDYMKIYLSGENDYIQEVSESLLFSGLHYKDDERGTHSLDGFTNITEEASPYVKALLKSDNGELGAYKIAPTRTAFYLSLGFDDFSSFMENFEESLKTDEAKYDEYNESVSNIEKFLDIDIKDDFAEWIGEEVAFLQMKAGELGTENEFAVVFKVKDMETAQEKLDKVRKQIRKKTPVKFRNVTYKGYPIHFMSIKGFFKLILGNFFSKLEKPYFTYVDDYVVFSNHPNTLKSIINDFQQENTLSHSEDFKGFLKNFDRESNLFVYTHSPILKENIRPFVENATYSDIQKNEDYFICFPHMGFQMKEDGSMFSTKLAIKYDAPEKVRKNIRDAKTKDIDLIAATDFRYDQPLSTADFKELEAFEADELIAIDDLHPEDLDAKKHQEFFEGGELKLEVPMKNGLKNGTYREYYINGNIRVKGKYRDDKKNGIWKRYDENGKTIERRRFRNGVEAG